MKKKDYIYVPVKVEKWAREFFEETELSRHVKNRDHTERYFGKMSLFAHCVKTLWAIAETSTVEESGALFMNFTLRMIKKAYEKGKAERDA